MSKAFGARFGAAFVGEGPRASTARQRLLPEADGRDTASLVPSTLAMMTVRRKRRMCLPSWHGLCLVWWTIASRGLRRRIYV
ncbi:hypothetical protein OOK13_34730 [Streptomyces sp. NBC_00378]|uniref:hypothetical protein n=1 Tax=unclassified Streptomyces TaxID=2593676 RepID=UPI00224EB2ED|nr:hypothetical protein [Streptomyces sp. NBC_00378]MCX5113516.1 hypothetical protein [Streptomyces sp. NBC_00378]